MEVYKTWINSCYLFLQNFDKELSSSWGIPQSIKLTAIKPSGTTSLLAGTTPGLHFPFAKHYIRRV
jgi:ribonucleoside-triphosphate reductase